jgi:hypothetical protein
LGPCATLGGPLVRVGFRGSVVPGHGAGAHKATQAPRISLLNLFRSLRTSLGSARSSIPTSQVKPHPPGGVFAFRAPLGLRAGDPTKPFSGTREAFFLGREGVLKQTRRSNGGPVNGDPQRRPAALDACRKSPFKRASHVRKKYCLNRDVSETNARRGTEPSIPAQDLVEWTEGGMKVII